MARRLSVGSLSCKDVSESVRMTGPVVLWPPLDQIPHRLTPPYDRPYPPLGEPGRGEIRTALYDAFGGIELGAFDRAFLDWPWDIGTAAELISLSHRLREAGARRLL